jgi:Cu2+-containing amine oxidase
MSRLSPAFGLALAFCIEVAFAQAPIEPLSEAEAVLAAELAEGSPRLLTLRTETGFHRVGVELFRDKEIEAAAGRAALVTHYRYEGDLTIRTVVDLRERRILSVEALPHVPTPLSMEEFERAKGMALEDARVAGALGADRERVVVESLSIHTPDPSDRYFGHRVVRLLFRVGPDYLSEPIVNVDLTSGTVELLERPPVHDHDADGGES